MTTTGVAQVRKGEDGGLTRDWFVSRHLYADVPDSLTSSQVTTFGVLDTQPHEQSRVVITTTSRLPRRLLSEWLTPVATKLSEFLRMPKDWHASGARRIEEKTAIFAFKVAAEFAHPAIPPPDVIPVVDGSIQLEWEVGACALEIAIAGWEDGQVVFIDNMSGEIIEGSLAVLWGRLDGLRSRLIEAFL